MSYPATFDKFVWIDTNNMFSNNSFEFIKYELNMGSDIRRMAENGFAPPPPGEFCRHILSCRELKAESFKRCLHSVLRGVSLWEPVTYVTQSN